jgi:hypothetical protein
MAVAWKSATNRYFWKPQSSNYGDREFILVRKILSNPTWPQLCVILLGGSGNIRCIMHRRIGSPVIPWIRRYCCFAMCSNGFTVIDESNVLPASTGVTVLPSRTSESSTLYCPYMIESTLECFKFLNCELFFSEKSINTLLRALHRTWQT